MDTKICVVVAVAVFNHDIMTDLETDAVTVVIACFYVAENVPIAILQKDAATVVAVKVFTVRTITIERNVLNQYVCCMFARQQGEQRCTSWLAAGPKILAKSVV